MDAINSLLTRLEAFNVNSVIEGILNKPDYKQLVPQIVRDRLAEKGTYKDDQDIYTVHGSPYTKFTVEQKRQLPGLSGIYSHVTLFDTGEFYKTFTLKPYKDYFSIEYNDAKPDGKISDNIPMLDKAISIGGEELEALITYKILPDFIYEFKLVFSA